MVEPHWRKSTRSGTQGGDCVEVAVTPEVTAIRDSKDRNGADLRVPASSWKSFLSRVRAGRYGG